MGRSGQRPRKGKRNHPQHLAKVGTPAENERLQHAEREAVLDNLGIRRLPGALRILVYLVVALLVAGAIYSLLFFIFFR